MKRKHTSEKHRTQPNRLRRETRENPMFRTRRVESRKTGDEGFDVNERLGEFFHEDD